MTVAMTSGSGRLMIALVGMVEVRNIRMNPKTSMRLGSYFL